MKTCLSDFEMLTGPWAVEILPDDAPAENREQEVRNVADNMLRVMTFNLLTANKKKRSHPWRLRRRNIARIFDHLKPDVVGTQEANYRQLVELAALLPDYDFVGEGNLGRDRAEDDRNWYCATFYRRDRVRPLDGPGESEALWLSPTPEVPASQYNLGTRPRLVTWTNFEMIATGRVFVFGTTHLEAINSRHRRKSTLQLREQISRRVAAMGPDTPVFLTGDFNAVSDSPEIRHLGQPLENLEPLYDAWAEARPGEESDGATFRGLGLRDRMSHRVLGPRRIDYVFFRPRLAIRSADRVDFRGLEHRQRALPSDHYPVLVEFSLAG